MLSSQLMHLGGRCNLSVSNGLSRIKKYGEGVAKAKIVYYAKSGLQKQALLVLERHGA